MRVWHQTQPLHRQSQPKKGALRTQQPANGTVFRWNGTQKGAASRRHGTLHGETQKTRIRHAVSRVSIYCERR